MTAVSLAELGGWPAVLRILVSGGELTSVQAAAALRDILEGSATPSQTAGFIVALRMKGETVAEMSGLVTVMRALAEPVDLGETVAIDTCGTGGSEARRRGAVNVSTIASFVIAGAGVPVCKHGNRRASSTSGSADLLEALGVVIDLGPEGVARCVVEAGMGFCFAPRYHPAMRHAGPTRRELGVPTVFNFLGPLANPARVRRQVLGVSDPDMAERMLGVLQTLGTERALIVYGHDGLDELTTTDTSTVLELRDGEVRTYAVDPTQLGLARVAAGAIQGGDVRFNADLVRRVLGGETGPYRDLVALNAAAGLVAGGLATDLIEGVELALVAIDEGRAASVLDRLVDVSRAASDAPA